MGPMSEGQSALARRLTGQGDDLADLLGLECRRGTRTRCITQPLGERLPLARAPVFAPALHGRAPDVQLPSRLAYAASRASHENDACAHHQTLRCVMLSHDGFKTVAVLCGDVDRGSSATGHSEQFPEKFSCSA